MLQSSLTVITCIIIIACVVLCIFFIVHYSRKFAPIKKSISAGGNIEDGSPMASLLNEYKKSFDIQGKTTEYANETINLDSIADAYDIRLKFMAILPSFFTSLGILGTFIGLSIALGGFEHGNSDAILKSIDTLIGGMGSAFWTSVFGMAASTVFLIYERLKINHTESDIDAFCSRLDKEHHISVDEAILSAFSHKDEDNFDILPGEAIANMSHNLKLMKTTLEQFGTNLYDSIGNALDNTFEEKIVPILVELAIKLENPAQALTDSLITELKEVCNNLETNLTKNLNEQMTDLLERFVKVTESINQLPEIVDEVNKTFHNSSTESIEACKEISKVLDEQIIRLSDLSDAFSINIEKSISSAEKLHEVSDSLANVPESIRGVSDAIEIASTSLKETNAVVGESIGHIKESNEVTVSNIAKYAENIQTIQTGLASIFEQVQEGLTRYSEATRDGLQEMLNPFTTTLTDATTKVTNSIAPLNDAVSDLGGFGEIVKNSLKDLSAALSPIENSIRQLKDIVQQK